MLAKRGEEFRLLLAGDRRVATLIHGRHDEVVGFRDRHDFFYLVGGEVREAEALECAGLVELIDTGKRVFQGRVAVGGVEVEDVDLEISTLESFKITDRSYQNRLNDRVNGKRTKYGVQFIHRI